MTNRRNGVDRANLVDFGDQEGGVEAESIEEAVAPLADCPMDMWVHEAMPM